MIGLHANIASLLTTRTLDRQNQAVNGSLERLATGQRINRGADGPAALISSENLRSMLASIEAESRALQRTEHVSATVESDLGSISGLVSEAEALVVASANEAGLSDAEREANQMQLNSIMSTIDRIAGGSSFNGQSLLDGSLTLEAGGQSVEVDAVSTGTLGETEIDGTTYALASLTEGGALDLSSGRLEDAQAVLRNARSSINTARAEIGGFQAYGIKSQMNGLQNAFQEIASAESMIRDTDYAKETGELARALVLRDAAAAMSGMANDNARQVLSLVG